jgi:hypothetical protein
MILCKKVETGDGGRYFNAQGAGINELKAATFPCFFKLAILIELVTEVLDSTQFMLEIALVDIDGKPTSYLFSERYQSPRDHLERHYLIINAGIEASNPGSAYIHALIDEEFKDSLHLKIYQANK